MVQALDRGLQILALVAQNSACSLTELTAIADMAPATVYRMLETLRTHGLVAFEESDQSWSIGVEAFRIGTAFVKRARYLEAGRPLMRRLVEETGETANIAIAQEGEVVYIAQIETQEPIRAFFPPGTRGPMHASGIGKALLAQMPRAAAERILQAKGMAAFTPHTLTSPETLFTELARGRARGWLNDDQERYLGMRCLATPIFNEFGEAIAGISISGPIERMPESKLAELGPMVRASAAEITARAGGVALSPASQ